MSCYEQRDDFSNVKGINYPVVIYGQNLDVFNKKVTFTLAHSKKS